MTYTEWIAKHVPENPYAMCAEVTVQMIAAFPGLRRVRGHYYSTHWGRRPHWWCIDPQGKIIDPTVAQFPDERRTPHEGVGVYEPWTEGDPEPTGKCMECGEYAYDTDDFCSGSCRAAFIRSL